MIDERSVTMTKQGETPAVQVPGRIPDQSCADCLDQSPAAERSRPTIGVHQQSQAPAARTA